MVETTALGAAGLAGLATGVWTTGSEFLAVQGEASRFSPALNPQERASGLAGWRRALSAATAWSGWEDGGG